MEGYKTKRKIPDMLRSTTTYVKFKPDPFKGYISDTHYKRLVELTDLLTTQPQVSLVKGQQMIDYIEKAPEYEGARQARTDAILKNCVQEEVEDEAFEVLERRFEGPFTLDLAKYRYKLNYKDRYSEGEDFLPEPSEDTLTETQIQMKYRLTNDQIKTIYKRKLEEMDNPKAREEDARRWCEENLIDAKIDTKLVDKIKELHYWLSIIEELEFNEEEEEI